MSREGVSAGGSNATRNAARKGRQNMRIRIKADFLHPHVRTSGVPRLDKTPAGVAWLSSCERASHVYPSWWDDV
jgi:hypothetical protein